MIQSHQRVVSSNIRSVAYDEKRRLLEVAFLSGHVYQYSGVPARLYTGLLRAGSKGKFFNQFVRKAGYRSRRVK